MVGVQGNLILGEILVLRLYSRGGGVEVSWVRDPICRKNGARLPHTGGRVWEALSLGETEVPLTGGGEREMRLGS